jgi:hypothetical protein
MEGSDNMRKLKFFSLPILVLLFLAVSVWVQPIDNMIYIQDVKISELMQYKISDKDDLSNSSEIRSLLPGNISSGGIGLAWGGNTNIQVDYGYYGGSKLDLLRLERFWRINKEKVLLFNATTYLLLVPQAERITMELDVPYPQKFEIHRKDLEKLYGRNLNEYYEDTGLWEKEVVKGTINSSKKLKAFFKAL